MPVRKSVIFALALALPTLTACGDGGDAAPTAASREITVVGTEMAFDPAEVTVPTGPLRVTFANRGAVYHELAIVSPAGEALNARSIPGGVTETFDVDLEEPGVYRMACREPGHTEAGMVGTLTVTG